MNGLTLTFVNRQGVTVTIVLFAFDRVHTNGDITLSPTRLDGKEVRIPASQVVSYGLREVANV